MTTPGTVSRAGDHDIDSSDTKRTSMDSANGNPTVIVAVVGALGSQGASVIRALTTSSSTSHWHIRALTSSPQSTAAQQLTTNPNISIVHCDVSDLASVRKAFQNCTHIFANTAFHGPTCLSDGARAAEKLEHKQAMNLVRAAAFTPSLRHFIYSTLMDGRVISGQKWHIPHFQSKQGANAFVVGGYPGDELAATVKEEEGWGALRDKTTLMCVGMFASNLLWDPYRPRKRVSGHIGQLSRTLS
jgi:Uri superfamily endonuclease